MREEVLRHVRSSVNVLLGTPTEEMDAQTLYSAIQDGIRAENEARAQSTGARSTLVLNGLLAAELEVWTKVLGQPRKVIKADF